MVNLMMNMITKINNMDKQNNNYNNHNNNNNNNNNIILNNLLQFKNNNNRDLHQELMINKMVIISLLINL